MILLQPHSDLGCLFQFNDDLESQRIKQRAEAIQFRISLL